MGDRNYNWHGIQAALQRIENHNPEFLPNTVLVGAAEHRAIVHWLRHHVPPA